MSNLATDNVEENGIARNHELCPENEDDDDVEGTPDGPQGKCKHVKCIWNRPICGASGQLQPRRKRKRKQRKRNQPRVTHRGLVFPNSFLMGIILLVKSKLTKTSKCD